MGPTHTYYSTYGRVLTILCGVGISLATMNVIVTEGVTGLLQYGAPLTLVMVTFWATFWQPRVAVDADGIRIQNVLRTYWVSWANFQGVTSLWSLEITDRVGTIAAWAIPRETGLGRWSRTSRKSGDREEKLGAAEEITALIEDYALTATSTDAPEPTQDRNSHWNAKTIAVLSILVLVSVFGFMA